VSKASLVPTSLRIETIDGLRVLPVMATTHEYTRALAALIKPLITGVGPVEGGVGLAATLGEMAARAEIPDVILALGSAGSRSLEHVGIYQAISVSYRDMDCSALGFARGVTPFSNAPQVFDLGPTLPSLRPARLSSGAGVVSGGAYDAIDADMVDMETFAYARAAHHFGVRLICLRGISDGRAPLSGKLTDWTDAQEKIGDGLAAALSQISKLRWSIGIER
jgi:adenosylhomocysteine nucleosidase